MPNIRDVYHDQIMDPNHVSRRYTKNLVSHLIEDLSTSGWSYLFKNRIGAKLIHQNKQSLLLWLMHYPEKKDFALDTTIITDLILYNHPNKSICLAPEVYGFFQIDFKYQNQLPTKQFNCFINRGCSFRQSWLYQFQRNNLLDQGHVSYWCEDRFTSLSPQDHFETLFLNNQIFEKEHIKLQGHIPYKNFDLLLEDAILDSKLSLVIETWFDDNRYISFSEKTWRVIQLPRPWLTFNSMHSVKCLREFGFDVFDDYVDHGYDHEPDPITRQIMILSQLNKEINYTPQLLEEFETRAEKNRQLLKKLNSQWPEKYKNILLAIQNIL